MTPARSSWSPLRSGFTLLLLALPLVACQAAPQVRGQIAGLRSLADLAEQSGAKKCAPRELALARAYLEFAELALEEGSVSQARSHLALAELNARAAGVQSPAEHCVPGGSAPQPGDRDGDGYLDPEDQCPEKPETFNGWDDLDGCPDDPDTDGDGLPDSIDACIILPEDADGYLDADGCPEPDDDLDQIPDAQDRCPREAEDPDGYEDDDGCPEPDNDGDGVLDAEDECPNTPGSPHTAPLGCPGNSLVVVTDCEVKITQQIHFATGRDVIQKESYPVLEAVAQVLEIGRASCRERV